MPVPKEDNLLPSDALVVKQVLDSMVPLCLCTGRCWSLPRHAYDQLVTCIGRLTSSSFDTTQGIKEYEPKVVHQLLDFMYRNVAEVLQVAEAS